MAFRFRRSIRIAPGIRWNFGKKSSSISIGRRGATLNLSSRGTRATVGIPGTGLSYTTSSADRQSAPSPTNDTRSPSGEPLTNRQIVAVFSMAVVVWGLWAGSAAVLAVGLAGLAVTSLWIKAPKPAAETIHTTTVGDDFDQFVKNRAVMLTGLKRPPEVTGCERPSRPASEVMTRAAQRERKISDGAREDLGDGIGYELAIVGESHYMAELRALVERRTQPDAPVEFVATLLTEPTNPYDPNAIVVLSDRGHVIGYLSREDAADYGPVLKEVEAAQKTAQCRAKLLGGTREKPNIGAWLDIDPPKELLARFAARDQPF